MFDALINLLYPTSCSSCGSPAPTYLCDVCRAAIRLRPATSCCALCGKIMMEPVSAGTVAAVCGPCHDHPPRFDRARSAAEFKSPVRDMIHKFKYSNATWLCRDLTDLLEGCVTAHYGTEKIDCLCPVPLNRVKARARGYNQAEVLGESLAKRLQVQMLPEILARTRNTPTQTRLNADARRSNVAGAFASPPSLRPWTYGRNILLIDDVMTTGATLSECAAALKANGAERVIAATVARD